MFQSTRPRGARRNRSFAVSAMPMFQSTRPRGARQIASIPATVAKSFNPRAHAGRDENNQGGLSEYNEFQSTRPRGARRSSIYGTRSRVYVSIHAPTRGATLEEINRGSSSRVSIHAPTRGATLDRPKLWGGIVVSIHAPTRGATPRIRRLMAFYLFQSTRPRGARRHIP